MKRGKEILISDKHVSGMIDGSDNNTMPHEFGHTGGLFHPDIEDAHAPKSILFKPDGEKDKNNAMFSGGSSYMNDKTSTQINGEQIETAKKEYEKGNLNKK